MGLITRRRPASFLLILIIEVVVGFILMAGGLALDLAIYDPPVDKPGFPFPVITIMIMFFMAIVLLVSAIIVLSLILFFHFRNKNNYID